MTGETPSRQDRLHVLIEIQAARNRAMTADKSAQNKSSKKGNEGRLCTLMRLWAFLAYMLSLRQQNVFRPGFSNMTESVHCIADPENGSRNPPFGGPHDPFLLTLNSRSFRAGPTLRSAGVRELPDAYLGWTLIVAQNMGPSARYSPADGAFLLVSGFCLLVETGDYMSYNCAPGMRSAIDSMTMSAPRPE